jgi:hypothetical protein
MRPKRPRGVTFLAVGVLISAALFASRASQSVVQWDFIHSLGISPAYLLATGLAFALPGLPIAGGLWFGRGWAKRWFQIYFAALVLYYWLDWIFLVKSPAAKSNGQFAVTVNVLLFLWVWWLFSRPRTRSFFEYRATNGEVDDDPGE